MLDTNTVVSFITKAPLVLSDRYERVKVVAKLDHELAGKLTGQNIKVLAARVAATIGPTFTTSFENLHYAIVQTAAGARAVIAEEWIEPASLVLENSTTDTFVISGMSIQQRAALLQILASTGINNYTHKTE